jgi:hypothetical protein
MTVGSSHGWNTYGIRPTFLNAQREDHWSKSDTVGIPFVGDTSPFTVILSTYLSDVLLWCSVLKSGLL